MEVAQAQQGAADAQTQEDWEELQQRLGRKVEPRPQPVPPRIRGRPTPVPPSATEGPKPAREGPHQPPWAPPEGAPLDWRPLWEPMSILAGLRRPPPKVIGDFTEVAEGESRGGQGQEGAQEGAGSQIARAPGVGMAMAAENSAEAVLAAWDWMVGNDPEKRRELKALTELMGGRPEHPAARALAAVTSFSTLFIPFLTGARAVGLSGTVSSELAAGAGAGYATGMLAMDPYEARLSTLLNEVPWLEPWVPDWLASTAEEDGELVNRMRNGLEEAGIGFAFEGLIEGFRLYRQIKRGERPSPPPPEGRAAAQAREAAEAQADVDALAEVFSKQPVRVREPTKTELDEAAKAADGTAEELPELTDRVEPAKPVEETKAADEAKPVEDPPDDLAGEGESTQASPDEILNLWGKSPAETKAVDEAVESDLARYNRLAEEQEAGRTLTREEQDFVNEQVLKNMFVGTPGQRPGVSVEQKKSASELRMEKFRAFEQRRERYDELVEAQKTRQLEKEEEEFLLGYIQEEIAKAYPRADARSIMDAWSGKTVQVGMGLRRMLDRPAQGQTAMDKLVEWGDMDAPGISTRVIRYASNLLTLPDEDWAQFVRVVLEPRRWRAVDDDGNPRRGLPFEGDDPADQSAASLQDMVRASVDPSLTPEQRQVARQFLLGRPRDPISEEAHRHFTGRAAFGRADWQPGVLTDPDNVKIFDQLGNWRLDEWIHSQDGPLAISDPATLTENLMDFLPGSRSLTVRAGKQIEPEYLDGSLVDGTGTGRAVWMRSEGPHLVGRYAEAVGKAVEESRAPIASRQGASEEELAELTANKTRSWVIADTEELAQAKAKKSLAWLIDDTVGGLEPKLARANRRVATDVLEPKDMTPEDVAAPARLDLMLTAGQQAIRLGGRLESRHDLKTFAEAVFRYQQWGRTIAGDEASAARAAQMANAVMSRNDRVADWQLEQMGGRRFVKAIAAAMDEAESFGEAMALTKHWADNLPVEGQGLVRSIRNLNTWRMASMLTDPATHIANLGGNFVPVMLQVPEHYLAAALQRDKGMWKEANAYAAGAGRAFLTGWRLAMRDGGINFGSAAWRSKEWRKAKEENLTAILMDFSRRPKADLLSGQYSPEALAMLKSAQPRTWMPDVVMEGGRKLVNSPFYALSMGDMYFKGINFNAEAYRLAAKQAMAEGLTGDAFKEAVRDAPIRRSQVYNDALKHAEEQTFTNDPGKWTEEIIDVMNSMGGLPRLVADIPFMRTPINLVSFTARRIPVSNLMFQDSRKRLSGAMGPDERAREVSRMILGSAIMAAGWGYAERGAITGSWSGNRWTRLQDPRDSARFGDTWVRYDKLPWFGPVFGSIADGVQVFHAAQTDEERAHGEAVVQLIALGLGRMAEQMPTTDLFAIFEILTELQEGEGLGSTAGRHFGDMAASFAPATGMQRALARTLNQGLSVETRAGGGVADKHEDLLEYWNEWRQEIANRGFPLFQVLREDAPFPRRDLYGEPMPHRGAESIWNRDGSITKQDRIEFPKIGTFLLGGMAGVVARNDPLSKELRKHAHRVRIDNPPRTSLLRGSEVAIEYTPEEYDFLAQQAGKVFWTTATALVHGADYRSRDDEGQAASLQLKAKEALDLARRATIAKFPALRERSAEATLARARARGE